MKIIKRTLCDVCGQRQLCTRIDDENVYWICGGCDLKNG